MSLTYRFLKPSFQQLLRPGFLNTCITRCLNYTPSEYAHNGKDPAPLFFSVEVQSLLKTLTRIDLQKVYRIRKLGEQRLEQPVYKFMTTEELEELVKAANDRVNDLIQMPPVVKIQSPIDKIVNRDPELQGLDTSRIVFTDVTFGVKDSDRLVVVREPDGTLQHAEWELRHRVNQLYFPKQGRCIKTPRMFQDEYLKSLLDREEYEFILDRACLQFEPFDSVYQRTTSLTYEQVNGKNAFDKLRSTRHFGPLAFYLVWFKNIDNLLLDLIETSHIEEANCLLELFSKVHDKQLTIDDRSSTNTIKEYIAKESQSKALLELALQAYKDLEKQKLEYEQGVKTAHGIIN